MMFSFNSDYGYIDRVKGSEKRQRFVQISLLYSKIDGDLRSDRMLRGINDDWIAGMRKNYKSLRRRLEMLFRDKSEP